MNHRSAITLLEVLVAIFVAAIGSLSLLVLFPLGALNMARAIRDDRCAQAALNAAALADALSFRTDANVNTPLAAGNPAYVDAYGVLLSGTTPPGVGGLGGWPGGAAPTTTIPRVRPSAITAGPPSTVILTHKWFRLLDDLTFASDGTTPAPGESFINRGGRYTWAYMARRSATTYGTSTQFPGASDLAVVVYDNRNTSIAGGESVYVPAYPNITGQPTYTAWPAATTSITLQYASLPSGIPAYYSTITPQIRRGSWILDASPKDTTVRNGTSVPSDSDDIGNVHSFFYRIVDYNDNGTSVQLDLEQPLVAAINGATQSDGVTAATNPGIIVILDSVANVYERRTGWRP